MDLLEEFRKQDAGAALNPFDDDYAQQPASVNKQHTNNINNSSINTDVRPIFSLKRIDWDRRSGAIRDHRSRSIQCVASANNSLIIALQTTAYTSTTTAAAVLRWSAVEGNKEPERIEIPARAEDAISDVFIDYSGHHVLIVMRSGENFYLHSRSQRPKKLAKTPGSSGSNSNNSSSGGVISCVAFDRFNSTENSTKSFLAGTSTGCIYEMSLDFSGKEKLCQLLYQSDDNCAISSVYFDVLGAFYDTATSNNSSATAAMGSGNSSSSSYRSGGSSFSVASSSAAAAAVAAAAIGSTAATAAVNNSSNGRLFVMWATASPTRLYHFTGGPNFSALFAACKQLSADGTAPFTELPSDNNNNNNNNSNNNSSSSSSNRRQRVAELHCYSKGSAASRAQNFALMTAAGIYHGSLLFPSATRGSAENVMLEAQHLPYPEPTSTATAATTTTAVSGEQQQQQLLPLSIAVTEFHFLVLRSDRLQIVSSLNGALVQEESINSSSSSSCSDVASAAALGFVRDPAKQTLWLFTTNSIFQVQAREEDQMVWRIYLERALAAGDEKLFDAALTYSKTKSQQQQIMRARATHCVKIGRSDVAAIHFAQSGLSFDEVALRLVGCIIDADVAAIASATAASVGGNSGFHSITSSQYSNRKINSILSSSAKQQLQQQQQQHNSTGRRSLKQQQQQQQQLYIADTAVTVGAPLTPLRVYLQHVLQSLPLNAKMQRTMLCTWLCDLFLHQIAAATTTTITSTAVARTSATTATAVATTTAALDAEELTAQFKDFIRANRLVLDVPTALSLILARNNLPLLLFFTQIVGDYQRVVGISMSEKRHSAAINLLSDAPIDKVLHLIYKAAPVLMVAEPEATVTMLLSKPQLSLAGILPALLSYSRALDQQLATTATAVAIGGNSNNNSSSNNNSNSYSSNNAEEEVAAALDVDFEGNRVNFAVKYLKETLQSRGFFFGTDDNSNSSSLLHQSLLEQQQQQQQQQLGGNGPEPAMFHVLCWLLARGEEQQQRELEALLQSLYEWKIGSNEVSLIVNAAAVSTASTATATAATVITDIADVGIDFEYLLRQCRRYQQQRAAVFVLLLLNSADLAVVEALAIGDFSLAKTVASQQPEVALQRQLWLRIAKHAIDGRNQCDVKEPIALIKESAGAISIDDLLPLLPDFAEIELFQDEICDSLQQCGDNIQQLKGKMHELAASVDSTVQELDAMKNRAYSIGSPHQQCECCCEPLFGKQQQQQQQQQQQFYLFPCSHGFHAHCLLQRSAQFLSAAQRSAVQGVEELLRTLQQQQQLSRGSNSNNSSSSSSGSVANRRLRAQQEALQQELDGFIAADCPLCGYAMIESLAAPLVAATDAAEAKSWQL